MRIVVVFGLPGAGKSFAGKVLEKNFGYYHHDGDVDLTEEMKQAIKTQSVISDPMRDKFFQRIIESVERLKNKHKQIVVSQTFIKEKYRSLFLNAFPEVKFILVEAAKNVRETRLIQRKHSDSELEYFRKMCLFFDVPEITHETINNNIDGEENLKKQFQLLSV